MSAPEITSTLTLPVHGMTCGGCVSSVDRALRRIDGVEDVQVSLEGAQATISYQPDRVVRRDLVQAVEAAGFAVPS